ncbi:hypothetical protein LGM75_25080 [Burkholderia multivorans]|uniref:hypothetical protein n=1 Tax=Burkholderia TaxID=32008 RepID=UPI0012F4EC36|nr:MULTISPECIES: hypothetical protein [Burkholderia]MBU9468742.1 hypothetical protein [Burkholderia multivorans]MCA8129629.1 hypothetical protein [Burkholderia multivorans]
MDDVNYNPGGSLLHLSEEGRCAAMQSLLMLSARRPAVGVNQGPWSSPNDASLATELGCAFQQKTGYTTSAVALTFTADDRLRVAQLRATGGVSAAILLIDGQKLGRSDPSCDWDALLLRVRNRFADDGVVLFAVVTAPARGALFSSILSQGWARVVTWRVKRFAKVDGIGFLGTVDESDGSAAHYSARTPSTRIAAVVASRLSSTAFFCCDGFRTSGSGIGYKV